jgi:hypothetical protein
MMDQKLCEKKPKKTSIEATGAGQIVLNSLTPGASFLISNLTSGSHKDSIIKETPLEGIWPRLQSIGIPKKYSWSYCQLLTLNLESKASLICKNISNPRLTQGVVRGGVGSQISPLTYSQYSYSW